MARILVAEDERAINDLICKNLELVGHEALSAFDGAEALAALEREDVDLALLDVMMPRASGFEVLRQHVRTPIIFVTAKDDLPSRLEGLTHGADDYVTKPFEILELLARVEAVLRRTHREHRAFDLGHVHVDLDEHRAFKAGEEVALAPREFDLLEALIVNRNLALSRTKLIELVWGYDHEGTDRTVDMHILRLRKKLGWEDAIETVMKVGYRLNAHSDAAAQKATSR